jgi:hypothetical protein
MFKELGLDYVTLSPRLLVVLGRVTGLSSSSNASSRVTLERLTPPNNQDPDTAESAAAMIEDVADVVMELGIGEMMSWRLYQRSSNVAE